MDIDPRTTTKSNKPRKGKANITEGRLRLRELAWNQVKRHIQLYLKRAPKGAAKRMAQACGISQSQIHRFTCPKCEHDQEPTFSIGFALLIYLSREYSTIDITPKQLKYSHAKKKPTNHNQRS